MCALAERETGRERERGTHRDRYIRTERERGREGERHTQRQKNTERERERREGVLMCRALSARLLGRLATDPEF